MCFFENVLRRCRLVTASLAMFLAALVGTGTQANAQTQLITQDQSGSASNICNAPDIRTQTITFPSPGSYVVSVLIGNDNGSLPNNFKVSLNGATILDVVNDPTVNPARTLYAANGTVSAAGPQTLTISACNDTFSIRWNNFSLLFTPTPKTGPPTDSQNLRNVQIVGTQIVAAQSGAAITTAVSGAIGDAFSPAGGPLFAPRPNGFTANFAAEPQQSDISTRADDAFAALGYARSPSSKPLFKNPPPRLAQDWSAWLDVRGAGFDRDPTSDLTTMRAQQVNVTAGGGRRITPDVIVGIFAGYENASVTMTAIAGKLNADGGTIGGYTAWRFAPNWRIDALGGWTGLNYSGTAGTASGSFSGSRVIGAGGITGTYNVADLLLEPSSNIYVLTEREGAWTDSLGTLQAARSFTVGRVATGAKLAPVPHAFTGNINISPYVGFYADWRFSTDNALPVAVTLVGLNKGWSGRATGGVALTSPGGASVTLGGEYGGLGAPFKVWAYNVRGTLPF